MYTHSNSAYLIKRYLYCAIFIYSV